MHHRRGTVCVPQGWDLTQELGGLLDEQSLHWLPNHDQGYPFVANLPANAPTIKMLTPDPTQKTH